MNEAPPSPPRRRWTSRDRWEMAAALAVIALRLALYPGDYRWKGPADWVLWVAAYWIFTVVAGHTRAWPPLTVLLVLALAGIYLEGNLSITVETLRWNLWP